MAPPMDKRCRTPKKGAATVRGEGLKGGHCIEDSLRFTNGMNLDGSSNTALWCEYFGGKDRDGNDYGGGYIEEEADDA